MALIQDPHISEEVTTISPQSGAWYGQYHLRGTILTLKDATTATSGALSFGTDITTAPQSPSSGTGIYIDYTGIYGLNNGVVQSSIRASDGAITANAGEIGGWQIGTSALYKDTGVDSTSAGMSPSDYPFYAGATYANRANAPYRVLPDGSVFATQYFKIGSNDLVFDNATDKLVWLKGLSFDRLDVPTTGTFNLDTQGRSWIRLTGTSAAKTISYIKKPSNIAGQILYIKNDANPVTATKTSKLTLKNNQPSPPTGYAALSLFGKNVVLSGFGTVTLIYDSANSRWTLVSVVKATATKSNSPLANEGYDEGVSVEAVLPTSTGVSAGTQVLAPSAGTLAVDMDVPASSTWTMELVTPSDGTTWLFNDGDIAYMRQGSDEIWFTVARGTNDGDTQTYTCTYASGTRPLSFPAGSGVVNYAASGQGFVYQTVSSGLPYLSVRTHSGSPWSAFTERVRLGSLSGITDPTFGALSGYGLWTDNVYLTGAINATAGSISGTLTVTGTLRNAAPPNARYELSSAGLKTYDSSNVQRVQILNDGSGWLGSSSVLSWTSAGVVSLNGSAVVGNSLDASKVSFTAPTISGLTFTNNSPSAGYVAWSSFKLTYQGTTYTVNAGNSNLKYIYWKKSASTTVLQTSATIPANAPDMFIVCVNFSGTAYQSNFAPFIYADYISVGQLSAIAADLGSITAGTVTGATIRTSASGARTEMNGSNLFGLGFGGIGGTDGTTTQWYAKASDGKFYFAGGNGALDSSGLQFIYPASYDNARSVRFVDAVGGTAYGGLYYYKGSYPPYTYSAVKITASGSNINTAVLETSNNSVSVTAQHGGISGTDGSGVYVNGALLFRDNNGNSGTFDIGMTAGIPFPPRDVYIGRGLKLGVTTIDLATNIANPLDNAGFSIVRVSYSGGAFTIRGITTDADGSILVLVSYNNNNMTLAHQNTNATAGQRIITPTAADITCKTAILMRDATTNRWRVVSYA